MGYWRENITRSLRHWEGREQMAGLLIVLVVALGFGVVTEHPVVTYWSAIATVVYLSLLLFVVTPWQMWSEAQHQIEAYRESLSPKLSFVFEPDTVPFLHHFTLKRTGHVDRRVRLYRIGIRNDSAAIIKRVRVVVESMVFVRDGAPVPPSPNQPALVEHALNVMGIDKKSGTVTLSPGDRPTAYVDVIEQFTPEGKSPEQWMSLCYATGHRTPMAASHQWILGLRVEGGSTYSRQRFVIEGKTGEDITMRPYGIG